MDASNKGTEITYKLVDFKIDPLPYRGPAEKAQKRINIFSIFFYMYFAVIVLFHSLFELSTFTILVAVMLPLLAINLYFINLGTPYIEAFESARELFAYYSTASDSKPFVLLLRSFESRLVTETIKYIIRYRGELRHPKGYIKSGVMENEEVVYKHDVYSLLTHVGTSHHIVVINDDRKDVTTVPFSVLASSDSWEFTFKLLAEFADIIVIIPELSTSLREETDVVIKHFIKKTLFLMPPSMKLDEKPKPRNYSDFAQRQSDILNECYLGSTRKNRWADVVSNSSISFPEYSTEGFLFTYTDDKLEPQLYSYSEIGIKNAVEKICGRGSSLGEAFTKLELLGFTKETFMALQEKLYKVKKVKIKI